MKKKALLLCLIMWGTTTYAQKERSGDSLSDDE